MCKAAKTVAVIKGLYTYTALPYESGYEEYVVDEAHCGLIFAACFQHPSYLQHRIRDFRTENDADDFSTAQSTPQTPTQVNQAEGAIHIHADTFG